MAPASCLQDVASVTDGLTEATTYNRINGQPGIGLQIVKQSDANAVEVSQGVKKRMAELKTQLADVGFDYVHRHGPEHLHALQPRTR
jgi:HAE1 family hydrophobic/amphiphilic exporter-1